MGTETAEILAPQAAPPGVAGPVGTHTAESVAAMSWNDLRSHAKSVGVSQTNPATKKLRNRQGLEAAVLAYHAEFPSDRGEAVPEADRMITVEWLKPPIDKGKAEAQAAELEDIEKYRDMGGMLNKYREAHPTAPVIESVTGTHCGYCSLPIDAGAPCTMTPNGPAHSACHDEMTEEPTPDAPFPEEVTDTVTEDTAPPKQEWHFISRAPAHMEMIDGGEEDRLSGKTLTQARFAKFGDPPHAAGHWITTDPADAKHLLDSASFAREDIKLYENFKAKAVAAQMADAEIAMAVGRREPAPARPPLVAKYLRQLGLDPVEAPGKVQISGSRALTGSSRGKSAGQPPSRPDVVRPTGVYEAPEHSMLNLNDEGSTFIG